MATKPNPYLIDEDAPQLTDTELAAMRPAHEVLPPELYAVLTRRRARGDEMLRAKTPPMVATDTIRAISGYPIPRWKVVQIIGPARMEPFAPNMPAGIDLNVKLASH